MRSYDPAIRDEPLIYRLEEAVMHYGEGIKMLVNGEWRIALTRLSVGYAALAPL